MRDLSLILFLSVFMPLSAIMPQVGLYLWVWVSLMNPHRLSYGLTSGAPLNQYIAIITMLGWLFSRERHHPRLTPFLILLTLLTLWFALTTFTIAVAPDAVDLWTRDAKSTLLVLFVLLLMGTKVRIHGLLWVIVMSLGYFGVWNGLMTAHSGGQGHTVFPPDSMISDNNTLVLALTMILPLMFYLFRHTRAVVIRVGLFGAIMLTLVAVVGSYSRGGLIALVAVIGYLWIRSRAKVAIAMLGVLVALTVLYVMPDKYLARAETIETADQDLSFQSRLNAWHVAWSTALDHPLGAGFDGPRQPQIWYTYAPDAQPFVAHSIYFEVLGDHGFGGLAIYLLMLYSCWHASSQVIKRTRGKPEVSWLHELAAMCQASMVGFCVGGAALSMAYYDGFLILLGIMSLLPQLAEDELKRGSSINYVLPTTGRAPKLAAALRG